MIEELHNISDGARQEMDELTKQLSQVSESLSSIPTVLGELQDSTESSIIKINTDGGFSQGNRRRNNNL